MQEKQHANRIIALLARIKAERAVIVNYNSNEETKAKELIEQDLAKITAYFPYGYAVQLVKEKNES